MSQQNKNLAVGLMLLVIAIFAEQLTHEKVLDSFILDPFHHGKRLLAISVVGTIMWFVKSPLNVTEYIYSLLRSKGTDAKEVSQASQAKEKPSSKSNG